MSILIELVAARWLRLPYNVSCETTERIKTLSGVDEFLIANRLASIIHAYIDEVTNMRLENCVATTKYSLQWHAVYILIAVGFVA